LIEFSVCLAASVKKREDTREWRYEMMDKYEVVRRNGLAGRDGRAESR